MNITLKEVASYLDKKVPNSISEGFDNTGLLIGKENNNIKKVIVCLDITEDIINEAIEKKANLIVSHHPMFLSSFKNITDESLIGRKIIKLIENNIAIYAMHTNFDLLNNKTSSNISKALGYEELENLVQKDDNVSLGVVVNTKSEKLINIIKNIKRSLNINTLKVVGNFEKEIKTAAIVAGSGMDFIEEAKKKKVDLFITGDIKYHKCMDCLEDNICVIDIGHFNGEVISLDDIIEIVKELNVEVIKSEKLVDPFIYI